MEKDHFGQTNIVAYSFNHLIPSTSQVIMMKTMHLFLLT